MCSQVEFFSDTWQAFRFFFLLLLFKDLSKKSSVGWKSLTNFFLENNYSIFLMLIKKNVNFDLITWQFRDQ